MLDENQAPGNSPEQQDPEHGQTLRAGMTPLRAAFLGLGGSFILYQVFGALMTLIIFGLNLENVDLTAYRLIQIAAQVLFLLLPALVFSKMIYSNVTRVLRFYFPAWQELALFSVGILILFPLINSLMVVQQAWFEAMLSKFSFLAPMKDFFDSLNKMLEQAYSQLLKVRSPADAILVFAVVALTPAVCEEMIFRGFIQTSFELHFNKWKGAVFTAFFFALYHFNPSGIIGLFILGWYFGYAAYKSNSIFVPMFLHFLHNGASIVLYLIYGDAALNDSGPVTEGLLRTSYLTAASLSAVFAAFIYIISRYYALPKPGNE